MPRPPLGYGPSKTAHIRLAPEDYDRWMRIARSMNLSLSEMVRRAVPVYASSPSREGLDLLRELLAQAEREHQTEDPRLKYVTLHLYRADLDVLRTLARGA